MMSKLKDWLSDWTGRANVSEPDDTIENPIKLVEKIFAMLAGLVAISSSPAISALAPNLSRGAALVLGAAIALATLVGVNYVVTAKTTREATVGFRPETRRIYR